MRHEDKVIKVLRILHTEQIEPTMASPNFVNDFAWNRDIQLTIDQVVRISDLYGSDLDPIDLEVA